MSLNTFIQNGELVIISRISFTSNLHRSLRVRIFYILVIVGIIPCFIMGFSTLKSYESKAILTKEKDIQNKCNILSNQLSSSDYLYDQSSDLVNDEILQLSNMFDGRILIIKDNFKIIKDTYALDETKTIISEEVIRCFKGETITNYDKKNQYIELTMPITDEEKTITGVMLMSVSTSNIADNLQVLSRKAIILGIVITISMVLGAMLISSVLVKPFARISKSIEALTDGYGDEHIHVQDYVETEAISDAFNNLLMRMKQLDDSRQEFVSNVSHELKTPLTSMKVLADSLLMQENLPIELYQEFMQDIVEEIDRENKIINDLLALVKLDKTNADLNIAATNINQLMELILKRLRPIAKMRNIELVFESFRQVTAEVDEVKLTLAISNLVENAIKYNIENGWVKVSLNADHKYFYVEVSDSGIGIPEDSIQHIFERFYRVDKSHSREIGGTGLGLSITRNAVLMHRGGVKVISKENEGTTFTVRIPLNYIS